MARLPVLVQQPNDGLDEARGIGRLGNDDATVASVAAVCVSAMQHEGNPPGLEPPAKGIRVAIP
jgi:hypothetical protein